MSVPKSKDEGKGIIVKEEFTGKNLTKFGGVGLIRRYFKKLSLSRIFVRELDPLMDKASGYSIQEMVMSILYGIVFGFSRPFHMVELARDSVFKKISSLNSFPSQSTISRFLGSVEKVVSKKMCEINLHLLLRKRDYFKGFFQGITLDLDSHVMTVNGNQQRASLGYNPKKRGRKSFHPIFAFIGETRDFVGGHLRSGKRHTSYNARAFVTSIMRNRSVGIRRLRADCGFFSLDFIKWLRKKGIEYYIAVSLQPWVQRMVLGQGRWEDIRGGISFKELTLPLGKTISTRLVVVRTRIGRGEKPKKQLSLITGDDAVYDYQVIATNSKRSPYEVWKFYNKRANVENMIKEGMYSFGLDKVVSHKWAGNSLWFQLVMFSYNLMNWFKEDVVGQTEKKTFLEAIRKRLLLIPGKLVKSGRQYILKLERGWYWRDDYELALERLKT